MQTFLPAACLFYLVQWIRRPKATPFVVQTLLWVLPAVALMILQYLYYFGIIVPYQGGMVLEMSWSKAGQRPAGHAADSGLPPVCPVGLPPSEERTPCSG